MNLRTAIADQYGPATARTYDEIARTLIWAYEETLTAITKELLVGRRASPDALRLPRRILDLGTGTGNLSLSVARALEPYFAACPEAEAIDWVLCDASRPMAEVALAKLRDFPFVRTRFVQSSFQEITARLEPRSFDWIFSSFAVHHVEGAGKRDLFRHLRTALRDGGNLVVGDKMPPQGDQDGTDYHAVIASRCQDGLQAQGSRLKLSDVMTDLQASFDADGDRPSSAEDHVQWMREAGFVRVRTPFYSFGCGVVSGTAAPAVH